MNVVEFRDAIEKGLGRAILFLQANPSKDYFDVILNACLHVFKQNLNPHSLNTMLQIYQKGECSHCREKCVEIMISTKTIPHNIIEECHYDANPDIRKLVS